MRHHGRQRRCRCRGTISSCSRGAVSDPLSGRRVFECGPFRKSRFSRKRQADRKAKLSLPQSLSLRLPVFLHGRNGNPASDAERSSDVMESKASRKTSRRYRVWWFGVYMRRFGACSARGPISRKEGERIAETIKGKFVTREQCDSLEGETTYVPL